MKNNQRKARLLRDGNLDLLCGEEVERESTAETAKRFSEGDEYLDCPWVVTPQFHEPRVRKMNRIIKVDSGSSGHAEHTS